MQQTSIKKRVIGVDIGNALTTYAIVDVRGNVIAIDSFPTSDYPDVAHYIEVHHHDSRGQWSQPVSRSRITSSATCVARSASYSPI